MTSITCYGGVKEIGGSKILLEEGDTRLLFDFGTPFGRLGRFFNEFLRPRAARGLLDPLLLGLIPPLEGLYRQDLATGGLWERLRSDPHYRALDRSDRLAVDAILVSHAHLDHNGDLAYLDERIPVYGTRSTAFIARIIQVTGTLSMEREIVYANPREDAGDGSLSTVRGAGYQLRPYRFLDGPLTEDAEGFWMTAGGGSRKKIEGEQGKASEGAVAGLAFRWWPVDHSIPGAVGYAVRTSAGWVAYTGDIRFHGKRAPESEAFMRELATLEPAALICEGTHVAGSERPIQEADIIDRAIEITRKYIGKFVIADFAPRNLERLESFLEVARQTGRTLAVQPKDIYMLEAMHLADPTGSPDPTAEPNLAMYADPKVSPRGWESETRDSWAQRMIGPEHVDRDPGGYILAFSLWDLNDLLDLGNTKGGVYLFSNSRAYDDEQAADLDRLRAWVEWAGMDLVGDPDDKETVKLHASGHAAGPQLLDFVRHVQPKRLVTVHTEQPGWWSENLEDARIEVIQPKYGVTIQL
jgi:ribonuclease J